MEDFKNIKNIYFIGIGGIGMSALARFFNAEGKKVGGYDKTATKLTESLIAEGIEVTFNDKTEAIPAEFFEKENTLIVYTPAIPKNHEQFLFFQKENYQLLKRSAVLGRITRSTFTLAVAGTHGKTTTTAILGHLLYQTGAKVTAFLGGISKNYNSNLILNGNDVAVVEADEFDRSFLTLSPNIAAITSVDADHLDIYAENEHLQQSFRDFAALVPQDGEVFVKNGLPLKGTTVGIADDANYAVQNIKIDNGAYFFDLKTPTGVVEDLHLNMPGKHNLMNAATAFAMALVYGSKTGELKKALASFKGVDRRFNYILKSEKIVLIDDYAHHPAEIAAVHQAVREMHPKKTVLAVFQPHLYSRTRDFAEDFAKSLSAFDQVILLDIYPAREMPIEGISSAFLLDKIAHNNKQLVSKENLPLAAQKSGADVVVLMGAGDIGDQVENVKQVFKF